MAAKKNAQPTQDEVPAMPAPLLHITCLRPGLRRGMGVAEHPAHASYALDAFTAAQLAEMAAEPLLVLLVGDRIVSDTLAGAVQALGLEPAAAEAQKA